MINKLGFFLDKYFDGLILAPGLFYSLKHSIRFELSPSLPENEKQCTDQIFERSITLFNKLFSETDEMLFVTDVHSISADKYLQRKPLNVYSKYVKQKQILYKPQYKLLASVFDEEDRHEENGKSITHRFVLPCRKKEINYLQLLMAISYEDFAHPTTILKNSYQNGYDIYFVNVTRKLIYHLYDDRGCDVLASNKEDIHFLYEEDNDWILEYDRAEIDHLFLNEGSCSSTH